MNLRRYYFFVNLSKSELNPDAILFFWREREREKDREREEM